MPTTSRAKRRIIRHQLSPLSGDSNQDEEEHTTSDEDEADKIELDEMPTQETACESPILSDNPNEESFISEDQELLRSLIFATEMSSSSSEDESRSNYDSDENKTGEDIGILDEALDDEDGSLANSSEGELIDNFRDPDWNANMEDEETDSSADDELEDDGEEVREGTSQDAR
ncbi:nucleolin-like [Dendronephthya gigantea]|uniref:nucleolin-like n=1 Tax=Dendronephthya gigantea TaxID=151771 RepID=UPI00106D6162|nr:nucleolin-like [Dendronephthya gigantea]